ncbi:MAG: flagellar motor switch protein FliG, partial [Bacteroidales bacterium]|nr:flagellar motor switch protein FliG [Bacteroidales bacterium]
MDRGNEKYIFDELGKKDAKLADEIRKKMFVFEDIVLLSDRDIQKVMREVDSQELSKALKSVDTEVQDKIFKNMSKR